MLLCSHHACSNRCQELNVRGALGPAYCLRHRMLHFLQNFVYYVTLEVIGPRGHELESWLDKAEDLDEVMELHEKFLDTCLKECLLASQDLLQILTKIMTTCLLFADQMQRFAVENSGAAGQGPTVAAESKSMKARNSLRNSAELTATLQQRQNRLRESAEFIQKESTQEAFVRSLNKFSETFDTQVRWSREIFAGTCVLQ
jgi:gamma-tubulin complex component 2